MYLKIIIGIGLMIISYFIGNLSPATLLARGAGKDITAEGSGNAGATNVLRVLGPKAAIVTLVIDVAKGFIAVKLGFWLGYAIANKLFDPIFTDAASFGGNVSAWCGLAVFLGHVWPAVFKFKGGKGVATALGVILATDWSIALICLGIFLIIVIATRIVSLGSIVAAVAFPFVYVLRSVVATGRVPGDSMSWILFIFLFGPTLLPLMIMAVILIIKHKENIQRIVRGEERKLSFTQDTNNLK